MTIISSSDARYINERNLTILASWGKTQDEVYDLLLESMEELEIEKLDLDNITKRMNSTEMFIISSVLFFYYPKHTSINNLSKILGDDYNEKMRGPTLREYLNVLHTASLIDGYEPRKDGHSTVARKIKLSKKGLDIHLKFLAGCRASERLFVNQPDTQQAQGLEPKR